MKKPLISIICIISILLLSTVLSFAVNIKTVEAQQSFNDEFNSTALNSNWVFTDPIGGSTVDLNANSGFLRITTKSPPYRDLYKPVNTNAPKVLTSTNGNFTIDKNYGNNRPRMGKCRHSNLE